MCGHVHTHRQSTFHMPHARHCQATLVSRPKAPPSHIGVQTQGTAKPRWCPGPRHRQSTLHMPHARKRAGIVVEELAHVSAVGLRIYMCVDMCMDVCIDTMYGHVYGHVCGHVREHAYGHWEMPTNMCMDMCVGMCIDVRNTKRLSLQFGVKKRAWTWV